MVTKRDWLKDVQHDTYNNIQLIYEKILTKVGMTVGMILLRSESEYEYDL